MKVWISCFSFIFIFFILPKDSFAQTSDLCQIKNYATYQDTYGFLPINGKDYSYTNPLEEKNHSAFKAAKEKAIKWATSQGVDPVLAVWWVFYETGGKKDSYSYSNCSDKNYSLDHNCATTGNGQWQLGYGQQFSTYPNLIEAFQKTHGDPKDVNLTKNIGQNVLDKAGQKNTFPEITTTDLVEQFTKGSSDQKVNSRYWISVLMRDPDISMYLLSSVLKGYDSKNPLLKDRAAGWSSYYSASWQASSNLMNDITIAWSKVGCESETAAPSQTQPTSNTVATNSFSNEKSCDSKDLSAHEKAICLQSQGLLPSQIDQNLTIKEPSYFQRFVSSVKSLLGFSKLFSPGAFVARSEANHQAGLPEGIRSEISDDLVKQAAENLGNDSNSTPANSNNNRVLGESSSNGAGIYEVNLPDDLKKSLDKTCTFEQAWEKAVAPEGIYLLSGKNCEQ